MTNQRSDLKKAVIRLVEFSYQWYQDSCKEEGYDATNVLSAVSIETARSCAVKMKKYMDSKANYAGESEHKKLDKEISKLNNERIGHMLDALQFAKLMAENGQGFNVFLKNQTSGSARGGIDSTDLTPLEKRINERWNKAMELQKG